MSSTLETIDPGDLHETLRKHKHRRTWLVQAERFLASENDVCKFSYGYVLEWDWTFTIDIPRSVWEPQLRRQVEEIKAQLAALDSIARQYMEAALK